MIGKCLVFLLTLSELAQSAGAESSHAQARVLPVLDQKQWKFTECELKSGWDAVRATLSEERDYCVDQRTVRDSSSMRCWTAAAADGYRPYLCLIRNLYAEVHPSGAVTWRVVGCADPRNASESRIVLLNQKIPSYERMPIEIGIGRVSRAALSLNESWSVSFYGMVQNVWHAMADVNAHWLSMHLLNGMVPDLHLDEPWTLLKYKSDLVHKSRIEYLYSRLYDSIVFEAAPSQHIRRVVLSELGPQNGTVLVRIPRVMFPLLHWFGLPWRERLFCPLTRPNRNPVYIQWQSLVNEWMTDLIHRNGRTLVDEMCERNSDRFRLFEKLPFHQGRPSKSQSQGWKSPSQCRLFWQQLQKPLLFFGDRHKNGRHSTETCGTHRCIGNLNETRNGLLTVLNDEFSIVMGNPGELSLQSQFELLQSTDLLFGMHGAMFALSQFMQPRSLAFEIRVRGGGRNSMAMLTGLGMRYSSYYCQSCGNSIENKLMVNDLMDSLLTSLLMLSTRDRRTLE